MGTHANEITTALYCVLRAVCYVCDVVIEETDDKCNNVVCGIGLNSGRKKAKARKTEHLVRLMYRTEGRGHKGVTSTTKTCSKVELAGQ